MCVPQVRTLVGNNILREIIYCQCLCASSPHGVFAGAPRRTSEVCVSVKRDLCIWQKRPFSPLAYLRSAWCVCRCSPQNKCLWPVLPPYCATRKKKEKKRKTKKKQVPLASFAAILRHGQIVLNSFKKKFCF